MTTNIESIVMRRVHTVHMLRLPATSLALAAGIFILALWGIGREVWVSNIVHNFDLSLRAGTVLTYLEAAFLNTSFIVQVLTVLTLGAVIWLAYNFVQLFRNQLRYI
jgi:hypothetical protein